MTEGREVMLILRAGHHGDPRGRYRVTQKASPRVVIVQMAAGASREELQGMDGVQAVLEAGEGLAADVAATLSPGEAVFVQAYTQRARHKERPGDGLNWGAEGFLPPDPPRKP